MNRFTLAANIKRCRNYRGFKQELFAEKIGVTRVMLSRYENGRSLISPEKLADIAHHLNVGMEELMKIDAGGYFVNSVLSKKAIYFSIAAKSVAVQVSDTTM